MDLVLEEALALILAAVPQRTGESIPLAEALGRVSADPLCSLVALPPFDNSSVDGYALRAADVASAKLDLPPRLRLVGTVAAGETFSGTTPPTGCVRLGTGSPLPQGADAVVMQEDTRVEAGRPDEVLILAPPKPGENVRRRGEDVRPGATLVEAGVPLTAARLSLLAAAGLDHLSVGRRPVVGLLATGSELKEPGQPLAPGQIYESNRLGLAALARQAGAIPKVFPLVRDDLAATRLALLAALDQCDAVVTSGGVSVGEKDFLKRAFQDVGGHLQFWRVAIKPGRPFAFGRFQGKFLFGLPGNPVSALVTFLLLVRPALLRWQGAAEVSLPAHPGRLAQPLANPGQRRHFLRVRADLAGDVCSAGFQASHALSALAAANGLVDMPPQTALPVGTTVQVLRWD